MNWCDSIGHAVGVPDAFNAALSSPMKENGFQSFVIYCYHLCVNKNVICENGDVILVAVSCSVYIVCAQVRSVSSQSDIANYWPGMHITAFVFIFADLYE